MELNLEVKKSAVDLTELAISILILGIIVSIGATVLISYRDTHKTDLSTVSVTHESITPTDAGTNFANKIFVSTSTCMNGTLGPTISTGNYTTSVNALGVGTITNITSEFSTVAWRCNYTYLNESSRTDYTLANQSAIGLGEYGNWFKILAIVGIAALILGIIFVSFGKGSTGMSESSEGGGSY